MNKFISIVSLLILLTTSLYTNAKDKNLAQLDLILKNRDTYLQQKENKINYLKQLRANETDGNKKYDLTHQLIEEYSNYQSDSAFTYIHANKLTAMDNKIEKQITDNLFQYIFVCAQSGLLNEAESELQRLYPQLPDRQVSEKIKFYSLYNRLYMNLREFSKNSPLESKYKELEQLYCDTILMYAPKDSDIYNLYQFKKNFANNDFSLAKKSILAFVQNIDSLSNDAARGYYHLYQIADAEKDDKQKMDYLIQSVSIDIQSSTMQNRSLRVLAEELYQTGNIKKAYQYMNQSLSDANFYNTRLRNSQIAEVLPIIEQDYQIQRNEQETKLRIVIIITITLLISLLGVSIYLKKKKKELVKVKKELEQTNNNLTITNREIEVSNERLSKLTISLRESDQIKEKYLGHFIKLCSTYIQNISVFKKNINRKIKLGQIEDVHNMTLSSMQESVDFKEFYEEFDKSFLNIYPDFIEKFNSLLNEDQRFKIKKDTLLNTELRIFALIRLGVKDSSQIADFMNYTPVTIYSYRTKVKSRAINKETFEEDIFKIN